MSRGVFQRYVRTQLDTTADAVSDWFDAAFCALYGVQLDFSAIAATSGEFFLEGTVSIDAPTSEVTRFDNADMDWWLDGAAGGSPVLGIVAGTLELYVKNPKPYMRVAYVRTAGGGATQVQCFQWGRGPSG